MSNGQRYRILAVDDEPHILAAYQDIFRQQKKGSDDEFEELEAELFGAPSNADQAPENYFAFELSTASQGTDAVAAVRESLEARDQYSVIFMDVRMPPGINGVDAAAQIRELDPDVNIVFVTGYSDVSPEDIRGAVPPIENMFYVSKPIQPAEIEQFAAALACKWVSSRDLSDANALLEEKCNELEMMGFDLLRARDGAETANKAKGVFLANMSHELRTPLNAILGFSEIMKSEMLGPIEAEYKDYIQNIFDAGHHLLSIVDDVLDLAKVEAGKIELREEILDVSDLVRSCFDVVSVNAQAKGVMLKNEVSGNLPTIVADRRLLQQVFLNLMSNAIKFTESGGSISLGSARDANTDGIVFWVQDTGKGISEADLEQVFSRFGQAKNAAATAVGGTGLGLNLARSFVELHGGHLDLTSELGSGTCVKFTLPHTRIVEQGAASQTQANI